MPNYVLREISWDLDDEDGSPAPSLPNEVSLSLTDKEVEDAIEGLDAEDHDYAIGDVLSDKLSDTYGFCHNGFFYDKAPDVHNDSGVQMKP